MPIKLESNRKAEIEQALVSFFQREFDKPLSLFQAGELVEFMLSQIGPSQYNQGIADAHNF